MPSEKTKYREQRCLATRNEHSNVHYLGKPRNNALIIPKERFRSFGRFLRYEIGSVDKCAGTQLSAVCHSVTQSVGWMFSYKLIMCLVVCSLCAGTFVKPEDQIKSLYLTLLMCTKYCYVVRPDHTCVVNEKLLFYVHDQQ